jgi:hypothetical protein
MDRDRYQFNLGTLMLAVALAAVVSWNLKLVADFYESLPNSPYAYTGK